MKIPEEDNSESENESVKGDKIKKPKQEATPPKVTVSKLKPEKGSAKHSPKLEGKQFPKLTPNTKIKMSSTRGKGGGGKIKTPRMNKEQSSPYQEIATINQFDPRNKSRSNSVHKMIRMTTMKSQTSI